VKQQVNLYQPIFRRQRKVFSAVTMLQVAGVVVLGLAMLYGYGRFQAGAVRADLATLAAQRDAAQAQLATLTAELAAQRDTRELTARLQQAEQTLATKRRLLRWLGEQGVDRSDGFSAHVEGLARQHRPGLQLTEVGLAGSGRQIRLAGRTADAAELVRFLRRLGDEAAFAGVEFRDVRIARDDDPAVASGTAPIGFVVDSQRAEAER
jgi:predicted RNA-binding Zn ribbon-like protein